MHTLWFLSQCDFDVEESYGAKVTISCLRVLAWPRIAILRVQSGGTRVPCAAADLYYSVILLTLLFISYRWDPLIAYHYAEVRVRQRLTLTTCYQQIGRFYSLFSSRSVLGLSATSGSVKLGSVHYGGPAYHSADSERL